MSSAELCSLQWSVPSLRNVPLKTVLSSALAKTYTYLPAESHGQCPSGASAQTPRGRVLALEARQTRHRTGERGFHTQELSPNLSQSCFEAVSSASFNQPPPSSTTRSSRASQRVPVDSALPQPRGDLQQLQDTEDTAPEGTTAASAASAPR
jgi:hypothetical protein